MILGYSKFSSEKIKEIEECLKSCGPREASRVCGVSYSSVRNIYKGYHKRVGPLKQFYNPIQKKDLEGTYRLLDGETSLHLNTIRGTQIGRCVVCGKEIRIKNANIKNNHTCSKECLAKHVGTWIKGEMNPRYNPAKRKICPQCKMNFVASSVRRIHCSNKCYAKSDLKKQKFEDMKKLGKMRCAIDLNQKEIIDGLRNAGVSVLVCSDMGGGFPDLVVGRAGENYMLEIKNPNTQYGRRGFSKSQKKFNESWTGCQPIVVYSLSDALKAIGL